MSKIDDGGPIASSLANKTQIAENTYCTQVIEAQGGLSLRDYFAAAALQGLLASGHYTFVTDREEPMVAECYYDDTKKCQFAAPADAYQVADAMLAARKEGA
jgi:hypothetical protein